MEAPGEVRSVLLDESVVILGWDDGDGNGGVRPGALHLLRKLRHSTISLGIAFGRNLPSYKISLLKSLATLHSCKCFVLDASCIENALNEIELAWGDAGRNILYLASDTRKDMFLQLSCHGWLVTVPRSDVQEITEDAETGGTCKNLRLLYIGELEELPLTICHLNKKALCDNVVAVGVAMKSSREDDFSKRGLFPLRPTQNGLIFVPLALELPLSPQLQEVDVILHKATDEIISIEMNSCLGFSNKITFSRGMLELKRHMEQGTDFCTIDPLKNIYPILDRVTFQKILQGLENFTKGQHAIRGPRFLKVDHFNDDNMVQWLSDAKLSLPSIVKPQVACGVADAHVMAIVFRIEDFKALSVPLPAVVQEYVDHSSSLFKIYVLGEKVFCTAKPSTPNASILMKLSEKNGLKPLHFDSLKSLPIEKENQQSDGACWSIDQHIDLDLVTDAANWLRKKLDLTIFGFDVLIQEGSGDHVIVDVNYLPSFKEIPDDVAIPAFWDAIRCKYDSTKALHPH